MKLTSSKGFDAGTIEIKISPESMASIDGEFSMLKEFNEKFATRESFLPGSGGF
jgi:hypothetical protein